MNLKIFKKTYNAELKSLNNLFSSTNSHCLIVCPDKTVIKFILDNLSLLITKKFSNIHINPKNHTFKDSLIALRIKENSLFQNNIYTFLENIKSSKNNFLILYSNRIDCVMNMEKRIRSRFNNEIIFFPIPNLHTKIKDDLSHNSYLINPTLQNTINCKIMAENKIKDIKLIDIYKMLLPVHLVLMIISRNEKLVWNNVVSKFRMYSVYTPELRKVEAEIVYDAFNDLLELQFVNKKFVGDWESLSEFVKEEAPIYVRNILSKK